MTYEKGFKKFDIHLSVKKSQFGIGVLYTSDLPAEYRYSIGINLLFAVLLVDVKRPETA